MRHIGGEKVGRKGAARTETKIFFFLHSLFFFFHPLADSFVAVLCIYLSMCIYLCLCIYVCVCIYVCGRGLKGGGGGGGGEEKKKGGGEDIISTKHERYDVG